MIAELFSFVDSYIRPLVYLVLSGFALYFTWKKIGNRVDVYYSIVGEIFVARRIDRIVLSNRKDKPVVVHTLFAVFENELWHKLAEFNPPKILKAYESIGLSTEKYSSMTVRGGEFTPDYLNTKIDIYIESTGALIRCNPKPKMPVEIQNENIVTNTFSFNNLVYDETVAFMLVYKTDEETHTAFISKIGVVGKDWKFANILIGNEPSVENIQEFLESITFSRYVSSYQIHQVMHPGITECVFQHSYNHT